MCRGDGSKKGGQEPPSLGGLAMGRISWWGDLTARRRDCAPGLGGCQWAVAVDGQRGLVWEVRLEDTPTLQPFGVSRQRLADVEDMFIPLTRRMNSRASSFHSDSGSGLTLGCETRIG